jgi:hypothetical protein
MNDRTQQFPKDGATLATADGQTVYARPADKSPAYTTDEEQARAEGLRPVMARRAYGILNNRATKSHAEKELSRPLYWTTAD